MTYKVAYLDVMDPNVQAEIRSELPPELAHLRQSLVLQPDRSPRADVR